MARLGTFDPELRPEGWFDDAATSMFDEELVDAGTSSQSITAAGAVASSSTFDAAAAIASVNQVSLSSTEAFGAAGVTGAAVDITSAGNITTLESVGSIAVAVSLGSTSVAQAEAWSTALISRIITSSALTTNEAVSQTAVAQQVNQSSVSSSESIGLSSTVVMLSPASLTALEAVEVSAVARPITCQSITPDESVTVAAAVRTLSAASIVSDAAIGTATVAAATADIIAIGLSDQTVFGQGTVTATLQIAALALASTFSQSSIVVATLASSVPAADAVGVSSAGVNVATNQVQSVEAVSLVSVATSLPAVELSSHESSGIAAASTTITASGFDTGVVGTGSSSVTLSLSSVASAAVLGDCNVVRVINTTAAIEQSGFDVGTAVQQIAAVSLPSAEALGAATVGDITSVIDVGHVASAEIVSGGSLVVSVSGLSVGSMSDVAASTVQTTVDCHEIDQDGSTGSLTVAFNLAAGDVQTVCVMSLSDTNITLHPLGLESDAVVSTAIIGADADVVAGINDDAAVVSQDSQVSTVVRTTDVDAPWLFEQCHASVSVNATELIVADDAFGAAQAVYDVTLSDVGIKAMTHQMGSCSCWIGDATVTNDDIDPIYVWRGGSGAGAASSSSAFASMSEVNGRSCHVHVAGRQVIEEQHGGRGYACRGSLTSVTSCDIDIRVTARLVVAA